MQLWLGHWGGQAMTPLPPPGSATEPYLVHEMNQFQGMLPEKQPAHQLTCQVRVSRGNQGVQKYIFVVSSQRNYST